MITDFLLYLSIHICAAVVWQWYEKQRYYIFVQIESINIKHTKYQFLFSYAICDFKHDCNGHWKQQSTRSIYVTNENRRKKQQNCGEIDDTKLKVGIAVWNEMDGF